jgi:hypothetical protein
MVIGMNLVLSPLMKSPALPAVLLLFGMLFCLALAHFAGLPWLPVATGTIYVSLFVWVSGLLWQRRADLGRYGRIDILFVAFVLIVLGSMTATLIEAGGGQKYLLYLLFFVMVPYLCGRLMCVADINVLMRFSSRAGLLMLPFLLLDRYTSVGRELGRWPFFGLDHGALLVGALLATALIALCVYVHDSQRIPAVRFRIVIYSLIGLMTVFLVWVMARGWLIAGLVGVAVVSLSMRHRAPAIRASLFAFVVGIVAFSLTTLPSLAFYSALLTAPAPPFAPAPVPVPTYAPAPVPVPTYAPAPVLLGPIHGEISCQPFREGVNSVAMRWVLYQEAAAMFVEHPLSGVGAARFGEHSCTGLGGFPHSTVLQGFAELGLIGGGVLSGLLALAAMTLVRPFLSVKREANWPGRVFILALFAAFLVADQIYGNYFMSVGMWLMLGIAASVRAHDKLGVSRG